MRKLCILAGVLLLAGAVFADINPINTRPITPAAPPSGELSLQQILDAIYGPGVLDATTDQQKAGMWGLPGVGVNTTTPILQFEQAGNAGSNIFGIWSGVDAMHLTMVPIFLGPASPDATAVLKWKAGSPDTVIISAVDSSGANTGTFPGINRYSFGFYLQGPGGTFYTADQLNGGKPQALAFVGPGNDWTFAFEDLPYNSISDFNDQVVTAESITPVPDGGVTLMLLGGALIVLENVRRRFRV